MHILKEVLLTKIHPRLRMEMKAVAQAAYFTVLIEQATETETPIPEIHKLFTEAVDAVEKHPGATALLLAFELRLLRNLGAGGVDSSISNEARLVREALGTLPWGAVTQIPLDQGITREIENLNRRGIGAVLGKIPKQRDACLR